MRTASRPVDDAPRLQASSEIPPRRVVPAWCVLVLQLIAVAAVVAIVTTDIIWWIPVIIAVLIGVWFIPIGGRPVAQTVREQVSFRLNRDKRHDEALQTSEPFDISTSSGSQFGFRWDGDALVSMLEIADSPEALTVLQPGATVDAVYIPVQVLAESLHQFDITLAAIDLHISGSRSRGGTEIAAVYDHVLGPLPAIAHRSVWLTIRLDPTLCPEAISRRGGGSTGILKTAITGSRRVANRLREHGFDVRSLTAAEISRSIAHLSGGLELTNIDESWETCSAGQMYLRSYGLDQPILTSAGLDQLWTVPSHATTVSLSLRTMEDRDLVQAHGIVRFDTFARAADVDFPGLSPLHGRQFDALIGSLPLPRPARERLNESYGTTSDFGELRLPAAGCGQVIGADRHGRAVALPVFGPTISRVEIAGSLHLTQQLVLRAIALGARVLVYSRRPAEWREMVSMVNRNNLLWVAEFNRGTMHASAAANYSVMVFDQTSERPVNSGVTRFVVNPIGSALSEDADVTLAQLDPESDEVRVTTSSGTVTVEMVASDEEMQYVGSSYDAD
ncbi:type VII secretion protein EccE [Gordonia sp. ABSL1-1]|uniref:type VII secretion protein EccE n=1 Tax=Gordonia sp. ABSL1-1 TaxID=3053923 RepID=UPI002573CDC6|nr:type VII secretion protein EccE [Gordonia sp. ABSL1-1]MDL9937752.1 type VII secretion protein EccE [Gordonia sp. ABSL1-1]